LCGSLNAGLKGVACAKAWQTDFFREAQKYTPTILRSENRPSLEGKLKRATKKSGVASKE
jgi:hypothetical protein